MSGRVQADAHPTWLQFNCDASESTQNTNALIVRASLLSTSSTSTATSSMPSVSLGSTKQDEQIKVSTFVQGALNPYSSSEATQDTQSIEECSLIYMKEGLDCLKNNKFALAVQMFQNGLSNSQSRSEKCVSDETNALLSCFLGNALERCGDSDAAIEAWEKGLTFQKAAPKTLATLHGAIGSAYFQKNKYLLATKAYLSALEIKSSPDEYMAQWYHGLGCAYQCLDSMQLASEAFLNGTKCLEASPNTKVDLFISLGIVQRSQGNFSDAISSFNSAAIQENGPLDKRNDAATHLIRLLIKEDIFFTR